MSTNKFIIVLILTTLLALAMLVSTFRVAKAMKIEKRPCNTMACRINK